MYRQDILAYAKKKYGTTPVHLWQSNPDYEVLRHEAEHGKDKGKWYALTAGAGNKNKQAVMDKN